MTQYKDIDMKFTKNPVTKDIGVRTGVWAVLQSVRNIVMTSLEEWETLPDMGGGMYRELGENITPTFQIDIEKRIEDALAKYEAGRVELSKVECFVDQNDMHKVAVKIQFYIVNNPDPVEDTIWMKRVN